MSAQTPTLDEITRNYPSALLQASGRAVGMTFGESGNSEVGHLTLGAGRVIFQYLNRINKNIDSGEFFENTILNEAAAHVLRNQSTLHIAGLITSGAVHAHINHLLALVHFAHEKNLPYKVHLFTDGRDSGLKEAEQLLKKLYTELGDLSHLATFVGRDFAMDRNNNWDKTEAAYRLIAEGTGVKVEDPIKALENYYVQNLTDGAIPPTVVNPSPMNSGDAIVFFNFREDSMRQILRVFVEDGFDLFLKKVPDNLYVATMTKYLESPNIHVMFPPPPVPNCLSEVLSDNGKKHFHIAETEKYAHVTSFFNGLQNEPFPGETDYFVESLEDPINNPQMRAMQIVQKVAEHLDQDEYDLYVLNLANGDMLAHLGNLEAAIKGVEAVDTALAIIKEKILEKNGVMIITADHGNVESMIYKGTGEKETRHDENPVPFHLIAAEYARTRTLEELAAWTQSPSGILADVAPTILELLGIEKPVEMTGESLLSSLL